MSSVLATSYSPTTERAQLVGLVQDFAQELEDSTVRQEISRFHNRLTLVNFYDGYHAV